MYFKALSFIEKFFHDLATMIKNFFTGSKATNNTERLFEKIGTGYYKKTIPNQETLNIDGAILTKSDILKLKQLIM